MLELPLGHATFTCATQLISHQALDIIGTRGRITIEIPWSMPADRPSRLLLDTSSRAARDNLEEVWFPACDQWGVMCDRFCEAIVNAQPAPIPIEDGVANMRTIDAIFRSSQSGRWETP